MCGVPREQCEGFEKFEKEREEYFGEFDGPLNGEKTAWMSDDRWFEDDN